MQAEGQVQQELHQHRKAAGQNQRPAADIQRRTGQVFQQRHHGAHQQRRRAGDGQGEGQIPVSAGGVVHIQQEQRNGRKVHRHEDHRVRPLEPHGQRRQNIQQHKAAHGEARPCDAAVDAPVAQHGDHRRQQHAHRHHEHHADAADLLVAGMLVRGIGRLALSAGQIGMKDACAAQRAHPLAVRQLHAAFDTIHGQKLLSLRLSAGCSPPSPAVPAGGAPDKTGIPAPAPECCGYS